MNEAQKNNNKLAVNQIGHITQILTTTVITWLI